MKILMMTNTYTPFVGGVPCSVESFTQEYRRRGHRTIVIAPEFEDTPEDEHDVIRIPALKNLSDAGFSVRLPIPGYLENHLDQFEPDIVHAHHPFLLGDTALRIARRYKLPLVFTHHTLYEQYTHYLPVDNPTVRDYVKNLVTGYCNLCDEVFAPSESVKTILKERGVETSTDVVPTGIDVEKYDSGDGEKFRRNLQIPQDAYLVGHLGRLAEEKNIPFLVESVKDFMDETDAHFLLVGSGPIEDELLEEFDGTSLESRFHYCEVLKGQELYNAYASMDVFAFASKTETQGMVLVEAMSSGTPVIALNASGSRDVVQDGESGRLIDEESIKEFSGALRWLHTLDDSEQKNIEENAKDRARDFSMKRTANLALKNYKDLIDDYEDRSRDDNLWSKAKRSLQTEWQILQNFAAATDAVIIDEN